MWTCRLVKFYQNMVIFFNFCIQIIEIKPNNTLFNFWIVSRRINWPVISFTNWFSYWINFLCWILCTDWCLVLWIDCCRTIILWAGWNWVYWSWFWIFIFSRLWIFFSRLRLIVFSGLRIISCCFFLWSRRCKSSILSIDRKQSC